MVLSFFKHFTFYIHIMIKIYFFLFRFLVLREWRVAAPTALAIVSSRQPISVGSVCKRSDVASNVRVQISVGQRTRSNQSAPSNKLLVRQSDASTTGKMWLIYGQSSIHSTTLHWITILETNWKPLCKKKLSLVAATPKPLSHWKYYSLRYASIWNCLLQDVFS